MIEDLRWLQKTERHVKRQKMRDGKIIEEEVEYNRRRILQAYDGHVWFDVPTIEESENVRQS